MVGLPYSNFRSLENSEKMSYLDLTEVLYVIKTSKSLLSFSNLLILQSPYPHLARSMYTPHHTHNAHSSLFTHYYIIAKLHSRTFNDTPLLIHFTIVHFKPPYSRTHIQLHSPDNVMNESLLDDFTTRICAWGEWTSPSGVPFVILVTMPALCWQMCGTRTTVYIIVCLSGFPDSYKSIRLLTRQL